MVVIVEKRVITKDIRIRAFLERLSLIIMPNMILTIVITKDTKAGMAR